MDSLQDLTLPSVAEVVGLDVTIKQFKQCPKFCAAIDKLYNERRQFQNTLAKEKTLPDRKLQFNEVRNLVTEKLDHIEENKDQLVDLKAINERRKTQSRKIEEILNGINRSAENGEVPKILIRNQRLWSNCIYDADRVTLKSSVDAKKSTIVYSNTEDTTRFNAIVFVLTKVHELLTKALTITRRELFYQNVVRFRNQSNVDVAVRDVCCLLESPPWELGLIATAKGLVAGPLTIETRDGKIVNCMVSGGTLIPQDVTGIKNFKSNAKYILVVEKDAIFQKLLDEGALLRLGPVIIISGKGYPDICTRQLLVRLCRELRLRALALVDADPHGYEIFLTYKFGSLALSHLSWSLACDSLQLLGALHSDVMTLTPSGARLSLTELDRRKINALMRRPYLNNNTGKLLIEELQAMLSNGVKAELEALCPNAVALCDAYIPTKIIQGDYLG